MRFNKSYIFTGGIKFTYTEFHWGAYHYYSNFYLDKDLYITFSYSNIQMNNVYFTDKYGIKKIFNIYHDEMIITDYVYGNYENDMRIPITPKNIKEHLGQKQFIINRILNEVQLKNN